jgi:hypothetical protein
MCELYLRSKLRMMYIFSIEDCVSCCQEGKKIKLSVCLCVCLCVCVNEIPMLIFYVRMLSDVSSLIWMPSMDGRH